MKATFTLVVRPARLEAGFLRVMLTNVGTYFIVIVVVSLGLSINKNKKLLNKQHYDEVEHEEKAAKKRRAHPIREPPRSALLTHLDEQVS